MGRLPSVGDTLECAGNPSVIGRAGVAGRLGLRLGELRAGVAVRLGLRLRELRRGGCLRRDRLRLGDRLRLADRARLGDRPRLGSPWRPLGDRRRLRDLRRPQARDWPRLGSALPLELRRELRELLREGIHTVAG